MKAEAVRAGLVWAGTGLVEEQLSEGLELGQAGLEQS